MDPQDRLNQGLPGSQLLISALRRKIDVNTQACDGGAVFGKRLYDVFERTAGGRMRKRSLVSVVEDDQFFRESLRRLIRSLGYKVEAFVSAADFLASTSLGETACLIADVNMPVMTGFELYRHLMDSGHAISTILVTANPSEVDRKRAFADGVVCYLRKPLSEQQLKRCLRAALKPSE